MSRAQRGKDRGGGEHSRCDVGDRDADARGRSVYGTCDAHQAAFALDDRIVPRAVCVRTRSAVSADRAIDQLRVHAAQIVIAQAEFIEIARAIIFHQHIGDRRELADDLLPFLRLDVDGHTALVPVRHDEIRRLAGIFPIRLAHERRSPAARFIAADRTLDLDHVRAEVAKHHRAVRSREGAGDIENANVLERLHGVSLSSICYSLMLRS